MPYYFIPYTIFGNRIKAYPIHMKSSCPVSKSVETPLGRVSFHLIRSHRTTLAVQVKPDGSVIVRAPRFLSESSITSFVGTRAGWIMKHSSRNTARNTSESKRFTNGEVHSYMGRETPLVVKASARNRISFGNDTFVLEANNSFTPEKGEAMMNALLRKLAREVFSERLANLLEKYSSYGFKPTELKIRTTRTRWGSCSAKGSINLSSNLLKKRPELIDYVIIHELCHLRHRNHGQEFHRLLNELCPESKLLRAELRNCNTA